MANVTQIPLVPLNDGTRIPQFGLGVHKVHPDEAERIVSEALEVGYRHIDTASIYANEVGVGRAIAASGIPRDELYITTKLWNDDQGRERVDAALDASLERLGLDRVDLYLMHWPMPAKGLYVESWERMVALREAGRTTSVGVCNFLDGWMRELIDATNVAPVVNQVEQHPYLQQAELDRFQREHDIRTEAWAPLGQATAGLFEEPAVIAAAEAHGKTPAQAILRWHVQRGTIVFPKTSSRARLIENADIFDFELSPAEFGAISVLERGEAGRLAQHPDDVN